MGRISRMAGGAPLRSVRGMTHSTADTPLEVVVAGGGIAAVETLLALRALAGERVHVTMLSASSELVYRPQAVTEPFSGAGRARYPLADICSELGAELVLDTLQAVEDDKGAVLTGTGTLIPYDALVIAVGARSTPALGHAHTFFADRDPGRMHELVRDIEEGYSSRIAFVVPAGAGWSLPLYELALMTAAQVHSMDQQPELTIVTPEDSPLAIFAGAGTEAVAALLARAGIEVVTGTYATHFDGSTLNLRPGRRTLAIDRVVTLPEQRGPLVRGLPADPHEFIPVSAEGLVKGRERVFAIGDASAFPIKQGGIATQQADVVAAVIAARAGADVPVPQFRPILRAKLLTGNEPLYMRAHIVGGESVSSVSTSASLWSPPDKVAGRYLAPYLAGHGMEPLEDLESPPVEVERAGEPAAR